MSCSICAARTGSQEKTSSVRSVVGRIKIAISDPDLSSADAAIRELFSTALSASRARRAPKVDRTRQLGSPYQTDWPRRRLGYAILLFHATAENAWGDVPRLILRHRSITYVPLRASAEIDCGASRDPVQQHQPLDLTPEQVYLAEAVRPNNDPFDALFAAQQSLSLPLISRTLLYKTRLVQILWA